MGLYSLSDLEYMFWAAIRNGSVGTIGAKGDPGGWTTGTDLAISDLNDIKTPGLYRQASGGNATLARNYPRAGNGAVLEVSSMVTGSDYVIQKLITLTGDSQASRVIYVREFATPNWSPWRVYSSTRVDQTAGRAIYKWDDVNNREQIIYGDTGWREITPATGWTIVSGQNLAIRRVGFEVHVTGYLSRASGASASIYNLPTGFRPARYSPQIVAYSLTPPINSLLIDVAPTGEIQPVAEVLTSTHYLSMKWSTTDAWPTTLPGTASGSIPNL